MQSIKQRTSALARTKHVLEHFQISTMTLWRWEQEEDFPQPLRRGKVKLFNLAAIEQWLAGGEV